MSYYTYIMCNRPLAGTQPVLAVVVVLLGCMFPQYTHALPETCQLSPLLGGLLTPLGRVNHSLLQ